MGRIVGDPDMDRAPWGMLEYSTPELVDGLMDGRTDEREWWIWRFCIAQPDFPLFPVE